MCKRQGKQYGYCIHAERKDVNSKHGGVGNQILVGHSQRYPGNPDDLDGQVGKYKDDHSIPGDKPCDVTASRFLLVICSVNHFSMSRADERLTLRHYPPSSFRSALAAKNPGSKHNDCSRPIKFRRSDLSSFGCENQMTCSASGRTAGSPLRMT